MVDLLQRLGLSGFVGVLIGLAVVTWVAPKTTGGYALTIFICVGLNTAVASIYRSRARSRNGALNANNLTVDKEVKKINRKPSKPKQK